MVVTEEREMGHIYDDCDGGICVRCGRCRREDCCKQVPCESVFVVRHRM